MRGPDQTVRVGGVVEGERGVRMPHHPDSGPIRVQGWYGGQLVFIRPLQIRDGIVEDLHHRPAERIRLDRLVFLHGGRLFVYPLTVQGRPVEVAAGQDLHLALGHLRLTDRFGHNVLG